jgi:hypothetical protein
MDICGFFLDVLFKWTFVVVFIFDVFSISKILFGTLHYQAKQK